MSAIGQDQQKTWADVLYSQALLSEGSEIPDPLKFGKQINEILMNSH
jgi:molecular chaperone HtpG